MSPTYSIGSLVTVRLTLNSLGWQVSSAIRRGYHVDSANGATNGHSSGADRQLVDRSVKWNRRQCPMPLLFDWASGVPGKVPVHSWSAPRAGTRGLQSLKTWAFTQVRWFCGSRSDAGVEGPMIVGPAVELGLLRSGRTQSHPTMCSQLGAAMLQLCHAMLCTECTVEEAEFDLKPNTFH